MGNEDPLAMLVIWLPAILILAVLILGVVMVFRSFRK
jgi:hypothetical protein